MNEETGAMVRWLRDNPETVRRLVGEGYGDQLAAALQAETRAALALGDLVMVEPVLDLALARVDWSAVAAAVA